MRCNEYGAWRRNSNEVRGLCWDYAANFSDNVSSIGVPKSTALSMYSTRIHIDPHHDEPLYYAIYNIILHIVM